MRLLFTYILVSFLVVLFAAPIAAQTEDELVAKFLYKAEKKQMKKVGYFVLQGSYGKLGNNSDYNKFVNDVSPNLYTATGQSAGIDGIYRSKEIYAGFGLMVNQKSAAMVGISYWLRMGSDETGDFNLTLVNSNDIADRTDFDLKSQVQIYGFSSSFNYYLVNSPDRYGVLHGIAVKTNLNAGFYFAKWDIWEGYTGYNLNTSTGNEIEGKLTGSAPGVSLGLSLEYPTPLAGLVVEGSASYLYLNFAKMKWYNSSNEEHVIVQGLENERVELDFSGPRANFGLKRYFSW
ncbi:MAG: hypothetical protein KAR42_04480 [candidate division Zixibacteria bacterium]|nr:hypothetical protein [candidate division Zixibacteria bacterium]